MEAGLGACGREAGPSRQCPPETAPSWPRLTPGPGLKYRLAREFQHSIETYQRAAKAHAEYGAHFHSARARLAEVRPLRRPAEPAAQAKALEAAANAARDGKDAATSTELMSKAAKLYRRCGTAEAASVALEKAAKDAERLGQHETARQLYLEIVDVWETEDALRRCKVPLEKAIQMVRRARRGVLSKLTPRRVCARGRAGRRWWSC